MKKSNLNKITGAMIAAAAVTAACLLSSSSVQAAELPNEAEVTGTEYTGMATDEAGKQYWYEEGVRQGTEGRGKEIYDPDTDAWYWLDAVQGGAVATSKDVYQESNGGKWVRYDENGRMVKGWQTTEDGTYYFDLVTGAMQKGAATIDGEECAFDENTGAGIDGAWYVMDGAEYWYEEGKRQGMEGRGKEIYDPASDAWYWLDAIDGGKKATGKDVYQESWAGEYADREDGTGKWVRYDENGAMIKGWNMQNGNTYYFEPITGAMAKGTTRIDDVEYTFDMTTGILQGERKHTAVDGNVDIEAEGVTITTGTYYPWGEGIVGFTNNTEGYALILINYSDAKNENMVIPSYIDDIPVTYVGLYGCNDIKSIKMPDTVKDAFIRNCLNLETIDFGNGIEDFKAGVNDGMVWGCPNIKEITIGTGIKNFDQGWCDTNAAYVPYFENAILNIYADPNKVTWSGTSSSLAKMESYDFYTYEILLSITRSNRKTNMFSKVNFIY